MLHPAIIDNKSCLDKFRRSHKMRASSGSLAQLVEQRTLNPFVAGSIPARPTNQKACYEAGFFIYPDEMKERQALMCLLFYIIYIMRQLRMS